MPALGARVQKHELSPVRRLPPEPGCAVSLLAWNITHPQEMFHRP